MDCLASRATIVQPCWFPSCHVLGRMVEEASGIAWIGVEVPALATWSNFVKGVSEGIGGSTRGVTD